MDMNLRRGLETLSLKKQSFPKSIQPKRGEKCELKA